MAVPNDWVDRVARQMDDLARFGSYQLATKDIDPAYPVLRELYAAHLEWSFETCLWHTLLYVAYYNLPSSYRAFSYVSDPESVHMMPMDILMLPTGIERRGLRGGFHMQEHLYDLRARWEANGHSLQRWLTQGLGMDQEVNWARLQQTLTGVRYNGRWAAYKTGEILMKVHDFPVQPTDMGMAFSSGPRWGLAQFFGPVEGNDPEAVAYLDQQGEVLLDYLNREYGLMLNIEELETLLCDFHSLSKGRYYVGKDIDEMQEQIAAQDSPTHSLRELWDARARALPHLYLGELHGRHGIDRQRTKVYRDTGQIIGREVETL